MHNNNKRRHENSRHNEVRLIISSNLIWVGIDLFSFVLRKGLMRSRARERKREIEKERDKRNARVFTYHRTKEQYNLWSRCRQTEPSSKTHRTSYEMIRQVLKNMQEASWVHGPFCYLPLHSILSVCLYLAPIFPPALSLSLSLCICMRCTVPFAFSLYPFAFGLVLYVFYLLYGTFGQPIYSG